MYSVNFISNLFKCFHCYINNFSYFRSAKILS
nr:MAG TPA: hypothetical protein [Caudoviricetes sp.]